MHPAQLLSQQVMGPEQYLFTSVPRLSRYQAIGITTGNRGNLSFISLWLLPAASAATLLYTYSF